LTGNADTLALQVSFSGIAGGNQVYSGPMVDEDKAYEVRFGTDSLVRVSPDGSSERLGTLAPESGPVIFLTQSPAYVFVTQRNSAGAMTWTAVRKSDGASRTLLSGASSTSAGLVALSDTRLIYRTQLDRSNGELRSFDLATGSDTLLVANMAHPQVGAVSVVLPASGRLFGGVGPVYAAAVLVCRPLVASGDCRDSDLVEVDANTGALEVLGRFPSFTSPARITLSGRAEKGQSGSPLTLNAISSSPESRVSDIYSIEAGRAGSLKRVTNIIQ
jgi:hypothetical protein